ncbi:MAG TPA: AAA family ATPase [Solirubrobacteraceae bacterium]|nr:AAA family ATPase [Solirubrobacteraceae bacterium]
MRRVYAYTGDAIATVAADPDRRLVNCRVGSLMVGRISSPLLVGRAAELDALERLLARAASGSGRAVLVTGEAGIGKSRLVSELEERARGRDVRVLVGECVELAEGELAFAPVISALREVMEDASSVQWLEAPQRGALATLWPAVDTGESEAGEREQLFEAIYRVLARAAQERTVLLIVEDVHWIDPSSRDLLAFLVRNARHDRIAVLTTYRPDELHRGHPLRPFLERQTAAPLIASSLRMTTTRLVVGRETATSPVPGESRCSAKISPPAPPRARSPPAGP